MKRVVLLLCVVAFGYGLAASEGPRPGSDPTGPPPPFDPGGPCPTNPDYPARTEVIFLPPTAEGYGSIQYPRTPLPPRTVALTFDDGPWSNGDERVFEILEERCIQAVFFHVGVMIEQRPDLVREAIRRGHGVGSHSWLHSTVMRYWSEAAGRAEIERGFASLERAAGPGQIEPFFRFPGLGDSPALRTWLAGQGIITVGAEAGADDWRPISAASVHARAVANLEYTNGGTLILHQTHERTVQALPGLLDDLNRRGFRFVRISGRSATAAR